MSSLGRSRWRGIKVGPSETHRLSGDGTNLRGVREEKGRRNFWRSREE